MKRRMLVKVIATVVLSTMVASNLMSTNAIYADPILALAGDVNVLEEGESNGYTHIGAVESFEQSGNKVTIKMTTGEYVRLSFLNDKVFRLYMDPTGNFQEEPTPNKEDEITKIIAKSEAEYENITPVVEDGEVLKISTDSVELRVEKATGKMELINKLTNKTIWKESEPLKYKDNSTVQTLETNEDEFFFGGGMQNGRFSHKGKTIQIKNTNNWVDGGVASPTPFYLSTNGYGVMRHTFKPGEYSFSSIEKDKVVTSHEEKRFDAYYFVEETPENIIGQFTELTGNPLLLPEYGFYLGHLDCFSRDWVNDETGQQSQTPKPGYNRQESLMVDAKNILDMHIENDMPLGYFMPNDGYGCGYGRADSIDGNIDNLKQFVDYTRSKGVQTGLWTESSLKPTGDKVPYLERDIDKEVGVSGTNAVKTDVAWVGPGYSFALNSVRQAAEGIENNSKDRARPFVFSLDGWAGTQRYAGLWSGDQTGGDWEYIRFHIPTYIGSGLSGQPNMGSDMDGIFGQNKIIQTRDFQWKAFTPIQIDMDGWTSDSMTDKTPFNHGEPYASINRMYLKMKAEMMPYIYTIANEAVTGKPMIRAMMLEYPNKFTYETKTQYQYMWGPNMLVAPVYQDTAGDGEGNDIRNEIYLPDEDQIWIDYMTGNQYRGGGVINNFDAPLWKVPMFIKNGAIIPMANENNTPEAINKSERKYEVYPSGDTSFNVYEDDGLTTDYKLGKSVTTNVTSSAPKTGKGTAVITVEPMIGDYEGLIVERTTEFVVNVSEKPSELTVNVGGNNVELTEASSLEEFKSNINMYYYDESPNLNKYATEGSDFANFEITTTPKVYVKVDKTNAKENSVQLTIKDFNNTQNLAKNEVNENLSVPGNFNAPEDLVTATAVGLQWDNIEGATSYDVSIDGTIYRNILENNFTDVNVEYDTIYNYRVRAVNNDGYSEWSEMISPKTALDPYRNVPKDMQVIWNEGNWSNEVPSNAVDGDPNSQFHSSGSAVDKPIIIDMQKSYTLEKLELLFRKNGNGSVKRAEIYSSLDGVHYEKLFSNDKDSGNEAWSTDGEPKTINFAKPIKARYFKLVVKESAGNFIAMREFRPYKVDGTNGQIVGDWNNSGKVEEGDLTFLQNYTGLSSVDSDWDYVSMADLNGNGLIDAYDIAYVTSKLEGGVTPTEDKLAGELMLLPSKSEIKAGETFTVDIVGTGLSDVNAFSVEIPLDSTKYELIVTPESTEATASMKNLSKSRVHGDGSQAVYAAFANLGENTKVSGTTTVSTITLKAKSDVNFDIKATNAILVDSRTMPKDAIANIVNPDDELPTPKPTTNKVKKENITVSGDENQLQAGMGLDKLIDGTTSSDDSSRMDLKWIFSPDQEDKGNLPFEMTFEFNEPKKMDSFTIYHRANGDKIHNASMKKVKAVGYLNGETTDLGEVADINSITTTYKLNNQVFDKIVITALEGRTDNHTLAINEIEFYEQKGAEVSGIEFVDAPSNLNINKVTPVFANVTPDNATNDYYRITSEDSSIVEVVRLDNGDEVKYYVRGLKDGKTNIVATTADGKFSVKQEVTVGNGGDAEEIIVSKPVNLKANNISNNSVSLSWNVPTSVIGLTEYVVYKDGKVVETVPAGTIEYVAEGLKANSIYGFKVTAKYSNGQESKPVSINTRTTK